VTAHRPAGAVRREKWTPAQVRALGVRTDIATLASVLGMSETAARDLYHADRLPVPVLRVGRRLVVPVQPILDLLGLGNGGSGIRQAARDLRPGSHGERPGKPGEGRGDGEAAGPLPGNPAA
jgi:hypothetical protein